MKENYKLLLFACGTLITVVLTMAGFWLVEGRTYITRAEAGEMIQTHAPYIKDREMILKSLNSNESTNSDLAKSISELNVTLAEIRTELKINRENRP